MRYFFEISYKGTDYHGWQKQNNASSVQGEVERCFSTLLKEDVEIVGSGRTDAGVHCGQQYFHTDLMTAPDSEFIHKINSFLPPSIAIHSLYEVDESKHARFDAVYRRYHYSLHLKKNPFLTETSLSYFKPLDFDKMNEAETILVGEQDFECFSKVKTDVHTFTCRIDHAKWLDKGDHWIFDIGANRFLRGMVRSIVGTLLEIGEGKRTLDDLRALIDSGDRQQAGPSVAARGLSLVEVRYPEDYFN